MNSRPGIEIKKLFLLLCAALALLSMACAWLMGPAAKPATPPATSLPTILPAVADTPAPNPTADRQTYQNAAFGLAFDFPAGWFGPQELVSEQELRVEVGSDVVYPYGTSREEQIYTLPNSYYVVVTYARNEQNAYWKDTFQALQQMQDGETSSDGRGALTRVRALTVGPFQGFEYIATLAEGAQTEPFYSRQALLFDGQGNRLAITGSPNNVQIGGEGWRTAYQRVDEINRAIFYAIVESVGVGK